MISCINSSNKSFAFYFVIQAFENIESLKKLKKQKEEKKKI
jgi:hypothetical protein